MELGSDLSKKKKMFLSSRAPVYQSLTDIEDFFTDLKIKVNKLFHTPGWLSMSRDTSQQAKPQTEKSIPLRAMPTTYLVDVTNFNVVKPKDYQLTEIIYRSNNRILVSVIKDQNINQLQTWTWFAISLQPYFPEFYRINELSN